MSLNLTDIQTHIRATMRNIEANRARLNQMSRASAPRLHDYLDHAQGEMLALSVVVNNLVARLNRELGPGR